MIRCLVLVVLMIAGTGGVAQVPPKQPTREPIPVDVVLDDLAAAYAKTFAETVTVRFHPPGAAERTDTLTIRMQGGEAGATHQKAMLELGTLRVLVTHEKLVAIDTGIPGRYYEHEAVGGSIPATIAAALPPLPLPELPLAAKAAGVPEAGFSTPTPYTGQVSWTGATADTSVHPAVVTLTGAGRCGPVSVTLNAETGRMRALSAMLRTRDGEGSLELTFRALDPKDPGEWTVGTEGRERVATLGQLRPPAAKPTSEIKSGEVVPDMSFSRPSLGAWSLYGAMGGVPGGAPASPAVVLLFRSPPVAERAAAIARDAQAGRAAVNMARSTFLVQSAATGSGSAPVVGAVVIIELGDFKAERLEDARQKWAPVEVGSAANSGVVSDRELDRELLWSSGGAQSIDRFAPGAGAAIIIVGSDRRLLRTIPLDGRAGEGAAITSEIIEALRRPNEKEAPPAGPR